MDCCCRWTTGRVRLRIDDAVLRQRVARADIIARDGTKPSWPVTPRQARSTGSRAGRNWQTSHRRHCETILKPSCCCCSHAVGEGLFYYHHVHEANAWSGKLHGLVNSVTIAKVHARRGDPVGAGSCWRQWTVARWNSPQAEVPAAQRKQKCALSSGFLSELDDRIETASAATALLARSFETANNRMVIARMLSVTPSSSLSRSNASMTQRSTGDDRATGS